MQSIDQREDMSHPSIPTQYSFCTSCPRVMFCNIFHFWCKCNHFLLQSTSIVEYWCTHICITWCTNIYLNITATVWLMSIVHNGSLWEERINKVKLCTDMYCIFPLFWPTWRQDRWKNGDIAPFFGPLLALQKKNSQKLKVKILYLFKTLDLQLKSGHKSFWQI